MRIWFPTIRAGSGSDVYVERLVHGLRTRGVDAHLQWFDHGFELAPGLLRGVPAPPGTDLIHANSWNGFAFARRDIPLVVTAFHCVFQCGYPEWKTYAQKLYHDHLIGRYERWSFGRACRVIAMTPSAADDFRIRFRLPQTEVIHGWVDAATFSPGAGSSTLDGRIRILVVGNESRRKGMDLLPEFRARLPPRFDITVIGGLRGSRTGLQGGIVYKRGLSIAEVVSEYRRSNIVASLSRYEGFGYSALEAMACARPVVAFDVAGIRDVVENGRAGILVSANDVGAMASACERLAAHRDEATRLGAMGRELTIAKFSEAEALKGYIRIYRRLVDLESPLPV